MQYFHPKRSLIILLIFLSFNLSFNADASSWIPHPPLDSNLQNHRTNYVHLLDGFKSRYESESLVVTTFSVAFANIFLIERNDKLIMIDSGYPGDERIIDKLIRKHGFEPEKIDYLILTHGHVDHSGGAHYFQEKYGITTIGHVGDLNTFEKGKRGPACPTNVAAKIFKVQNKHIQLKPFTIDILVDSEFDLNHLGIDGKIIPWPGHTDGSVVIQFDNILFVGDLISGKPFKTSEPMLHYYMCDLEENAEQIRRLLDWPGISHWYTGHSGPLAIDKVRRFNAARTRQ
ncbi:MAG: MBL fold metallo-hydrolase [Pseudomonadales bacterium]|nr:MBL fold metallo-hydrolase [Pseudomonadales bacterium]